MEGKDSYEKEIIGNDMRAILYARVSREEQAAPDKYSIPDQINRLTEFAKKKGWDIVADPFTYSDAEGASGQVIDNQDGLKRILEEAGKNVFDIVLVSDYDRLSRRIGNSLFVIDQLYQKGVQVYSLSQPTQVYAPGEVEKYDDNRVIVQTFSALKATLDISTVRRRYRAGMIGRVKRGLITHGCPYGYKKEVAVNDGSVVEEKYVPVPSEASIIRRIFDCYLNGMGMLRIAEELNYDNIPSPSGKTWCKAGVGYVLANEVYIGNIIWSKKRDLKRSRALKSRSEWIIGKGKHKPIISKEVFSQAQALRVSKAKFGGKASGATYLLTGLLKCGYCGGPMYTKLHKVGPRNSGRARAYICANHEGRRTCKHYNSIHCKDLDLKVLQEIKKLASQPETRKAFIKAQQIDQLKDISREIGVKKTALEKMKSRYLKQVEAYEKGVFSLEEFALNKQRLQAEESVLQAELDNLLETSKRVESAKERFGQLDEILENIEDYIKTQENIKKIKQILMLLVERIEFRNKKGEVKIFFKLK